MTDSRYARLERLQGVGASGMESLSRAKVALVGCGTLGGAYASFLIRSGIGAIRLIDRDFVEEHNLSTQTLFQEDDARQMLPKVVAAQRHLQQVNSACQVETCCTDLTSANAETLLRGVDLILDGTDNFETRFLLNDVAVKNGVPWIYTAVVGYSGLVMAIIPGQTACLRCWLADPPETGALPTCETVGVWPPVAQSLAAIGFTEALRLLTGRAPEADLSELNFETNQWRKLRIVRRPDCPTCQKRDFTYLAGGWESQATKLCGRDMVHLTPAKPMTLNLSVIAEPLRAHCQVDLTDYLLHLKSSDAEIYLFPDGRAFIKGVSDLGRARAIFNRYLSV